MRIVTAYGIERQRGFGPFAVFLFIAWTMILPSVVSAAQDNHVKILYFFSPTCKHCIDAKPYIISLSQKYDIEGLRFGEGPTPTFPFPVKAGDKKIAQGTYDVKGVPTLAILVDGVYRQKIEGAPDIQDAEVIVRGLAAGARTVTEASKKVQEGEITIIGWIIARGEYFKNAHFFITDRKTELPIKAWLPLEAMKSPMQKRRPRLMSDVIRKPVVLRGRIRKGAAGDLFMVKEEIAPGESGTR